LDADPPAYGVNFARRITATILRETYGERVGGNNEPQQIVDQVVAFIDREESRFEPDYSPPDLATKARAGWTDKNGIFEFTRDGLREATEGFDFHRVLDVLAENGALLIRKDGKRSKVKKVNGRPTRVYPVDSTKLHSPV
jgi:putative DNA primase/helicase